MYKYLKKHEEFIRNLLKTQDDEYNWKYINQYHKTQISFMQHERLVHLIITLAFGLFLMISIGITVINPNVVFGVFDMLIIVLLVPYIIHYFRLENGVQRWYELSNEIEDRCVKQNKA